MRLRFSTIISGVIYCAFLVNAQWHGDGPVYTGDNVGIGTSSPNAKLEVRDGLVMINRNGGNQLRLKTGSREWDFDVDVGAGNSFRLRDMTAGTVPFLINTSGNVGIGTTNPGNYKLAVEGKIGAREVVVTTSPWADHVFHNDYNLKPLSEVESFIKENKHLEGIPTEKEVKENGVNVGEIQAKLLEKIEELTLHMIEMKKENEALKSRLAIIEQKAE